MRALKDKQSENDADANAAIADAGYIAPHWPAPWGRDGDAVQQVVIDQEFATARVRRPHLQVAAWALPTLIAHGTRLMIALSHVEHHGLALRLGRLPA